MVCLTTTKFHLFRFSMLGFVFAYVSNILIVVILYDLQGTTFSLRHHVQTDSGAHTVSYPMGIECSFSGEGVKRPGNEADHSPPSNAEVNMRGAIPPLPQYVFMVWCLIKQ
jgi:hypothetical protein